jgi:hypothetical protein
MVLLYYSLLKCSWLEVWCVDHALEISACCMSVCLMVASISMDQQHAAQESVK